LYRKVNNKCNSCPAVTHSAFAEKQKNDTKKLYLYSVIIFLYIILNYDNNKQQGICKQSGKIF